MTTNSLNYGYVLFIDEAGDDGLNRVKPEFPDGASEWLCIGGLLTRAKYERDVVEWVKEIRKDINATQAPALHYRKLSPSKKRRACTLLAEKPVRAFAVCSHKVNMQGHRNERAAKRGGKQWFYNYCVRLLMERTTEMCFRDSTKNHGSPSPIKVIFSSRGGHSYGQTKAYWELLKTQAAAGTTFLDKREIKHQVLRYNLVDYVPHSNNAGLQLSDIVASAFYQAADGNGPNWDTEFARLLRRIVARDNNVYANFGVVLQPTNPRELNLNYRQKKIFKFYGYAL